MASIALRPADIDDIDELVALTNRSMHHDNVDQVLAREELEEDLAVPYLDLADDTRVALRDGELAGFARVWNPPAVARQERAYLFGEVDPAHRGQGVGRELLGWSLARARERFTTRDHDLPQYIRVDAYDSLEANHRLYSRFGFTPVRWFEELLRPLENLPTAPTPEGIELVPWPDDRDEELGRVRDAAFADHWGSAPLLPEAWNKMVRGHGGRPDLSVIAIERATGTLVGMCLNHAYPEDDELTGRREAWIDNLATLRDWRGRGLASAMIAWSLATFETAGFTHAAIGVDADNPTGAARLYRNLGFERIRRSITHEIAVR
jgi:mycothiol synthase